VAERTAPNAVIVSDYPPVLFGAYEFGSQRRIIPLSTSLHLTGLMNLPSFAERSDIVQEIVDRGEPVYFLGAPQQFLSTQRMAGARLTLRPEIRRKLASGEVIVYRILPEKWSFLARMSSASITPPAGNAPPVSIRSVTIDGLTRTAIFAHPDARVVFNSVELPHASSLHFSIAIDPTCSGTSAGATFIVEVDSGHGPTQVFSRTIQPLARSTDSEWIDNEIDVSHWSGQPVQVSFVTRAVAGNYTCAWALWGDPVIEPSASRISNREF
jgi:hypothetical protein